MGGDATQIFMEKTMTNANEIIINPYQFYGKLKFLAGLLAGVVFQLSDDMDDGISEERSSLTPIFGDEYQLCVVNSDGAVEKTLTIPNEIVHKLIKDKKPNADEFVTYYCDILNTSKMDNRVRRVVSALNELKTIDRELINSFLDAQSKSPKALYNLVHSECFEKGSFR